MIGTEKTLWWWWDGAISLSLYFPSNVIQGASTIHGPLDPWDVARQIEINTGIWHIPSNQQKKFPLSLSFDIITSIIKQGSWWAQHWMGRGTNLGRLSKSRMGSSTAPGIIIIFILSILLVPTISFALYIFFTTIIMSKNLPTKIAALIFVLFHRSMPTTSQERCGLPPARVGKKWEPRNLVPGPFSAKIRKVNQNSENRREFGK